jgi:hypothetical protein
MSFTLYLDLRLAVGFVDWVLLDLFDAAKCRAYGIFKEVLGRGRNASTQAKITATMSAPTKVAGSREDSFMLTIAMAVHHPHIQYKILCNQACCGGRDKVGGVAPGKAFAALRLVLRSFVSPIQSWIAMGNDFG